MDNKESEIVLDDMADQDVDNDDLFKVHIPDNTLESIKEEAFTGGGKFDIDKTSHDERKSLKIREDSKIIEIVQNELTPELCVKQKNNKPLEAGVTQAMDLNNTKKDSEVEGTPTYLFPNFIDEQMLNDVCFNESLEISPNGSPGPGKFFISIEKESNGPEIVYLIYVSVRRKIDGIKQESTFWGRVTPMLVTLEEMRVELLELGNKRIGHNVYILNEGDDYHVSVSSFDGKQWKKEEKDVPIEKKTILMGECANYLFLRFSAMEGKKKMSNFTTLLSDGSLHSCRYEFCHSNGRFGRNKEEIQTIAAKRTVCSTGGIQTTNWLMSFGAGYILEEKRVLPPGSSQYPPVYLDIGTRTSTVSDYGEVEEDEDLEGASVPEAVGDGDSSQPPPGELVGEAASLFSLRMARELFRSVTFKEESVESEASDGVTSALGEEPWAVSGAEERSSGVEDGEEGSEKLAGAARRIEEGETDTRIPMGDDDEYRRTTASWVQGPEGAPAGRETGGVPEERKSEDLQGSAEGTREVGEGVEEKGQVREGDEGWEESTEEEGSADRTDQEKLAKKVESDDLGEERTGSSVESYEGIVEHGPLEDIQEEDSSAEEDRGVGAKEMDEDEDEEGAEDAGGGSSEEEKETSDVEDGEVQDEESEGEGEVSEKGEGSEEEEASEEEEGSEGGPSREGSQETSSATAEEASRVFSFEMEGYFPLDITPEESEGDKVEEILHDIKKVKGDCNRLRADIRQEQDREEEWRRLLRGQMLHVGPLSWRLLEGSRRIRIPKHSLVFADGTVDQSPIPLEYRWREDPQMMSAYTSSKVRQRMVIRSYAENHEEILDIISDFLLLVLINKPEDVISFTKEYFTNFN